MAKGKVKKEITDAILDRALEHIKSVPYRVSLRWLFYRIFQEEYYKSKKDYKNRFIGLTSRARKNRLRGWYQSILSDDTRKIIFRGIEAFNKKEWVDEFLECELDKIQNQDYFLMIFFEAEAMTGQFKYYTKNIPLVSFRGDASIPYKWEIAKTIEWATEKYKKPVVVLYFGDCDEKGRQIYKSAFKDIENWCDVNFKFIYCGLTLEQADVFNLPISVEGKGYQWEALTDEQAEKIIKENVQPYQDEKKFKEIEILEEKTLKWAKQKLKKK